MVPEKEAILMKVAAPSDIMRYVVEKGFIAVDGVSLTIIYCDTAYFMVSLVAYTQQHTTLGLKKPGDVINLEVDIIAKYVERLRGESKAGVSLEFLGKHGFLAT
jgi:riboflavin synthase